MFAMDDQQLQGWARSIFEKHPECFQTHFSDAYQRGFDLERRTASDKASAHPLCRLSVFTHQPSGAMFNIPNLARFSGDEWGNDEIVSAVVASLRYISQQSEWRGIKAVHIVDTFWLLKVQEYMTFEKSTAGVNRSFSDLLRHLQIIDRRTVLRTLFVSNECISNMFFSQGEIRVDADISRFIIPVHTNRSHWSVIAVDRDTQTVALFDSLLKLGDINRPSAHVQVSSHRSTDRVMFSSLCTRMAYHVTIDNFFLVHI